MISTYTGHYFAPNDWISMARKRSLQTDPLIFGASLGFVIVFVAATSLSAIARERSMPMFPGS